MKADHDVTEWIPLVEPVGEKFALSKQVLELVGPIGWGRNLWQVKAFVAHLITYFEDGFEHFLDNEDDDGIGTFHVSLEFCVHLAKKFETEFLPVSPEWYYQLARAKLLTLKVPRAVIIEAKLGWFVKHHDPTVLAHGMVDLPRLKGTPLPKEKVQSIADALTADSPSITWSTLEETAGWLLDTNLLDDDELCTLLDHDSLEEYNEFIVRYTAYVKRQDQS